MSGTQTNFLDSLRESVRENPLAAALIGGGALWLLMGNDRLKRAASSGSSAAAPLADMGAHNLRSAEPKFEHSPPTAPEMENGSSQRVSETLREAASATSDAASGAADAIKDRVDEGVTYARESLGKLGRCAAPQGDACTGTIVVFRFARKTAACAWRHRFGDWCCRRRRVPYV